MGSYELFITYTAFNGITVNRQLKPVDAHLIPNSELHCSFWIIVAHVQHVLFPGDFIDLQERKRVHFLLDMKVRT